MDSKNLLNQLILHPNIKDIIDDLKKNKIVFPTYTASNPSDSSQNPFPPANGVLSSVEEIESGKLDPKNGEKISRQIQLMGYDESIVKFSALEGVGYFTSHSLVLHAEHDYVPSNFITFNFYTKSNDLLAQSDYFRPGEVEGGNIPKEDAEGESFEAAYKADYANDRTRFLTDRVPENSVLLIDGPLIGGQISKYTCELNSALLEKNVIPIFFVKNSTSDLVTANTPNLKGKFNSDMHWANTLLKPFERSGLFKYQDRYNTTYSKIFCYLKAFTVSPQRVEWHTETHERYGNEILGLLDLILYLLLAQGDLKNPQVRTIAVAEKFARSTIRLFDAPKLIQSAFVPTMNETRGFG